MIPMIKRHEVQVPLAAGFSHRQVAKKAGVSKRSVTRIAQEPTVQGLDQVGVVAERRVGRPSTVEDFRSALEEWLEEDRDLPTVELLHRLKHSRWVYVEVVPNQQVEALCRSLVNGFERSGGVPLLVVVDNPKTVVIHPKKEPIVWNRTFAQLAVDFGFGIELCAPRRGNQKGSVENLVGWVKGSFFKVRRFHDLEDLRSQLREWLEEANHHRPCRATGAIPAVLMADEHPRLRPLAVASTDYGLLFEVVVGPTGMVEHKGIRYAMPPSSRHFTRPFSEDSSGPSTSPNSRSRPRPRRWATATTSPS